MRKKIQKLLNKKTLFLLAIFIAVLFPIKWAGASTCPGGESPWIEGFNSPSSPCNDSTFTTADWGGKESGYLQMLPDGEIAISPDIDIGSSGDIIVVFDESRMLDDRGKFQKLNSSGAKLWSEDKKIADGDIGSYYNVAVDQINNDFYIRTAGSSLLRKFDQGGSLIDEYSLSGWTWPDCMGQAGSQLKVTDSRIFSMDIDSSGNIFIARFDTKHVGNVGGALHDWHCAWVGIQKRNSAGTLQWTKFLTVYEVFVQDTNIYNFSQVDLGFNNMGHIYVVFNKPNDPSSPSSQMDLYLAELSGITGTTLIFPDKVQAANPSVDSDNVGAILYTFEVSSSNLNQVFLAWETPNKIINLIRADEGEGFFSWSSVQEVANPGRKPTIEHSSLGNLYVGYIISGTPSYFYLSKHSSVDLSQIWGPNLIADGHVGSGSSRHHSLAITGDTPVVVWTEHVDARSIYAKKINSDGTVAWGPVRVNSGPIFPTGTNQFAHSNTFDTGLSSTSYSYRAFSNQPAGTNLLYGFKHSDDGSIWGGWTTNISYLSKRYIKFVIALETTDPLITPKVDRFLVYFSPDFSITITPSSETINPGDSQDYTVTVNSIGGFSGDVYLRASIDNSAGNFSNCNKCNISKANDSLSWLAVGSGSPWEFCGPYSNHCSSGTTNCSEGYDPLEEFADHYWCFKCDMNGNGIPEWQFVGPGADLGRCNLGATCAPSGADLYFSPESADHPTTTVNVPIGGSESTTLTLSTTGSTPDDTYTIYITGVHEENYLVGGQERTTSAGLSVGSTNLPPVADATVAGFSAGPYNTTLTVVDPDTGAGVTVYLFASKDGNGDGQGSYDPDGSISRYRWDWEDNGSYDYTNFTTGDTSHDYTCAGPGSCVYTARLEVRDNDEPQVITTDTVTITVTTPNTPPVADATVSDVSSPSEPVPTSITVTDLGTGATVYLFASKDSDDPGTEASYDPDPDGSISRYRWDWEDNGSYDYTSFTTGDTSHDYTCAGPGSCVYTARLEVRDNENVTAENTVEITVNPPPKYDFEISITPKTGFSSPIEAGDQMQYDVIVSSLVGFSGVAKLQASLDNSAGTYADCNKCNYRNNLTLDIIDSINKCFYLGDDSGTPCDVIFDPLTNFSNNYWCHRCDTANNNGVAEWKYTSGSWRDDFDFCNIWAGTKCAPSGMDLSLSYWEVDVPADGSASATLTVSTTAGSTPADTYTIYITGVHDDTYLEYGQGKTELVELEVEISNFPPTAAISCDKSDCEPTTGCIAYTDCLFHLRNDSTDPDGLDDIVKSEWDIFGWGGDPDGGPYTPPNALGSYTLPSLSAGNYTVELYVEDWGGLSDTETINFWVRQEASAGFMCSFDEIDWYSCEEITAIIGETLYIIDDCIVAPSECSSASEGATITSWQWTIDGTYDSALDDQTNFSIDITLDSHTIKLEITDSAARTADRTHIISAIGPILPEWKEISP